MQVVQIIGNVAWIVAAVTIIVLFVYFVLKSTWLGAPLRGIVVCSVPALVSLIWYFLDKALFALGEPPAALSVARDMSAVIVFVAGPISPPATLIALILSVRFFWLRKYTVLQVLLVVGLLGADIAVSKYVLDWLTTRS